MQPIKDDYTNVVYGENQKEYNPLPAHRVPNNTGTVVITYSLSKEELKQIQKTGVVYFMQMTFNNPLQPVLATVDNPLENPENYQALQGYKPQKHYLHNFNVIKEIYEEMGIWPVAFQNMDREGWIPGALIIDAVNYNPSEFETKPDEMAAGGYLARSIKIKSKLK